MPLFTPKDVKSGLSLVPLKTNAQKPIISLR